ncbi:MAG: outer membrane beta-barrel protein [Chitinophagaceae bacterium]
MKSFLAGCFFVFSFFNGQAQQVDITLKIINEKNEPVPLATFQVADRMDSLKVINAVADSAGIVRVALQVNSQYIVRINTVSYNPIEKGITINNQRRVFVFTADANVKTLQDVAVSSTRIVMKQEDDKTIVDVENLAASSTNTLEVIEKTPGLFIDQDGRIYLNGTTPASVLINGRDFRMSATDMASMLKSLPPNAVSKIELIRTPSAKYDAANSGGVVNVVLKKGVKVGLTGSLSAGMNQGKYGNQFAGINLNQNNGNLNIYFNTQFTRQVNYNDLHSNRILNADSLLRQDGRQKSSGNIFYAGYGFFLNLSKRWELGYDGRVSLNSTDNGNSVTSLILQQGGIGAVTQRSMNNTDDDISNTGVSNSISLKYKIDSAGSEWTTDVFHNYTRNVNDQVYSSMFNLPAATLSGGYGDLTSNNNLLVAQSDLVKRFPKKLLWESGVKLSTQGFKSRNYYYFQKNGSTEADPLRTAVYDYRETIFAGYTQVSKTVSRFVIKAGVRYENTRMTGEQMIPSDTSFTIRRGDFFPYIYLSRDLFPVGGYMVRSYAIYRRSISRPGYDYLNPAQRYVTPYLFETGNPSLKPQFVDNAEANISVESMPLFAIGVNNTKDIFTSVMYQADTNASVSYRTYENIGKNKELYLRGMVVIPPKGRYFFLVGAQFFHTSYTGFYESKPIAYKRNSWMIFSNQRFKLDQYSVISMNGFYRFNGLQQFYELGTLGAINLNINRQFMNRKLTVTLSVTDIFFDNNYTYLLNQGNINETGYRQTDSRRFGINLRYNFGLRKKEEPANIFEVENPEKTN